MPGTNMVVVEHVLRAAQAVRRVRPRIAAYVLMGLAVSGWMGFLVLAGVLLATRAAVAPGPGPLPESPIVKGGERDTNHKVVVKVQPAREPAPPPASGSSLYELGRYEERRRVQERRTATCRRRAISTTTPPPGGGRRRPLRWPSPTIPTSCNGGVSRSLAIQSRPGRATSRLAS